MLMCHTAYVHFAIRHTPTEHSIADGNVLCVYVCMYVCM